MPPKSVPQGPRPAKQEQRRNAIIAEANGSVQHTLTIQCATSKIEDRAAPHRHGEDIAAFPKVGLGGRRAMASVVRSTILSSSIETRFQQ